MLRKKGQSVLLSLSQRKAIRRVALTLSRRRLLPASVWKRLPVIGSFEVEVDERRAFTYVSTSRDAIGRALFWRGLRGEWEAETIPVFQEFARHAKVILDIGANTGVYSLLACSVSDAAKVHSFEPVPRVYELLLRNVEVNNFAGRCEPHAVAISNQDSEVVFHIPYADVPTSGSMHVEGFRGVGGELIRVTSATVDSIAASIGRIDLCKIDVEGDVEGFEDRVLEGMANTLAHDAPALVFECNPDGPYLRVESILKSSDYKLFRLNVSTVQSVTSIVPDPRGLSRNYLAVKKRDDIQIAERLADRTESLSP